MAEDDAGLRSVIERGLREHGFVVDAVADGTDALAHLRSYTYEVVVLDWRMPGQTGIEVVREMRNRGDRTPVLMLTARDATEDRVVGLNQGADDYLVKPFAFEELLARVRALLRRPPERRNTVLKIADLTLDTTTYEVARAGRAIRLSKKEFALLEYLIRNQNQILSKDTIITHVWDYDADILPNTVEVYIRYLRNKVDQPFSGPSLLHTVRGFGYKLEVLA